MATGTISLKPGQKIALRREIIERFQFQTTFAEYIAKLRKHRSALAAGAATVGKWQDETVDAGAINNIDAQIRRILRDEKAASSRSLPEGFLVDFKVVFEAFPNRISANPISIEKLLNLHTTGAPHVPLAQSIPSSLQELVLGREATNRSLIRDRLLDDGIHSYTLVHRIDHLDYPSKDYFSLRRLTGENAGRQLSSSLIYRECSENKLRFQELELVARDLITGQALRVEAHNDSRRLSFEHPFRIYFNPPLRPKGRFDIAYSIRLPRELEVIPEEDELMSVSLCRMLLPVKSLLFEVCLSFKPISVVPACLTQERQLIVPEACEVTQRRHTPTAAWERTLGLKRWSCKSPWRVTLAVDNPLAAVYILNYKR